MSHASQNKESRARRLSSLWYGLGARGFRERGRGGLFDGTQENGNTALGKRPFDGPSLFSRHVGNDPGERKRAGDFQRSSGFFGFAFGLSGCSWIWIFSIS